MKNIFMMAAISIAVMSCNRHLAPSTTGYSNSEIKNENGNTILAGHCALDMLYRDPYNKWFDTTYNTYSVDSSLIPQLSALLKNKQIEIFLGSWCGDSKKQVPRMVKILQSSSFDTSQLRLIFVDNSTQSYKQSPQHEEEGKNIHHVPAIIVYEHKNEIGRIIETPVVSLEKDLASILAGKSYVSNYKAIAWWQQNVKHAKRLLPDETLHLCCITLRPLCKGMGEFNAYGYMLLAQHNYNEALNIFRLNTFLYPGDANTFDSLAEAYYATGNNNEARLNYEKVLSLKPGDENAEKMLHELK